MSDNISQWQFFGSWSDPSWDVFIFLLFLVISLFYGFLLGRDRILAILVTTYIDLAIVWRLPYLDRLLDATFPYATAVRVTVFYLVFFMLFFFLSHFVTAHQLGATATGIGDQLSEVIVFSVIEVGLLVSTTLSFFPKDAMIPLAPITREVFTSDIGQFLWLVAPLVAVIIFVQHGPTPSRVGGHQ